jgi:antitoxin component HigA of HigAB toxin-antitoxin module
MNNILKINECEDYDKAVALLEQIAAKGEENLTESELKWMANMADLVAAYEEKNSMLPIEVKSVQENETDIRKIADALGYEPHLTDLIRFKMLQKKLNQKSLATLLNMGEAKVSQILSGKREPDVDFLRGIHTKLGIDGNVLLETA